MNLVQEQTTLSHNGDGKILEGKRRKHMHGRRSIGTGAREWWMGEGRANWTDEKRSDRKKRRNKVKRKTYAERSQTD